MPTENYGLPTISGNMTADIVRDHNALATAVDTAIADVEAEVTRHLMQNDVTKHKATQISFVPPPGMTATNVQDAISANFTRVVNGKNLIAAAINAREGSARGSDSFEELAMSVSTLPNGKKYATGVASTSPLTMGFSHYSGNSSTTSSYLHISGLTFKPSIIIISRANNTLNASRVVQYFANLGGNQDYVMQIIPQTGESTASSIIIGYRGNMLPAYVNNTGFRLPYGAAEVSVVWHAYE